MNLTQKQKQVLRFYDTNNCTHTEKRYAKTTLCLIGKGLLSSRNRIRCIKPTELVSDKIVLFSSINKLATSTPFEPSKLEKMCIDIHGNSNAYNTLIGLLNDTH